MILPTTNLAVLLLLVVSALCLGTWASTKKITGKWRFELYYLDFSIGALLCALIAAFTLGMLKSQDLTFEDTLLIAGKRQIAWAVAAGIVFNLANMFLVAAVQVAGMSVAFPIAFGVALSLGSIVSYFFTPGASALLSFSGAALGLIAVAVCAYTHGSYSDAAQAAGAASKPLRPDPRLQRAPRARKQASAAAGVALGIVSGIGLTLAAPLLDWAQAGEGVNSYSLALLFSCGILFSTIIYSPFFMTFPVEGAPATMKMYFAGSKAQHLWGILGGMVFMAGLSAAYAAATAPAEAKPSSAAVFGIEQAATLIAALCGLLIWREFKGAPGRVRTLLAGVLVLLAAGIGVVAVAPLYGK